MKLPEIPGYAYDELINEGTCGYVYRCTGSTGEERAVKILRTLAINADLVGTMYGRLSRAPSHPGIARIHTQNFGAEPYYYAMTLYGERRIGSKHWESPTLESAIGHLDREQALSCIDQLASAVAFLHRHEIIHTGLKPSSIFVLGDATRGLEVKVTDIGQGYVKGPQYLQMGDSGFYASPEQLVEGDYEEGAGRRWDVYAFGVIAYRLLTGRFPRLEAQHRAYLKEKAERAKDPATVFGDLSKVAAANFHQNILAEPRIEWPKEPANDTEKARRSVIERCLMIDPEKRFSDMREVLEDLKTRDHQIVLARVQQSAQEGEARATKSAAKWKKGTMAAGIAAGVVALLALFSVAQWKLTKRQLSNQTIQGTETIQEEREKFEEALDVLESENQSHIAEVSNSAAEFRATAEKAEALLSHAQRNGDRFFELVLDSRESDLPGFESKRKLSLAKGQKYYEEVAGVLGREPGQAQTTAQAYRFLGSIYREQGNLRDAEAALRQAQARYAHVNQGEGGRGPQGLINLQRLAQVNRDLARVLVESNNIGAASDAEIALQDSDAIWRGMLASDETNTEFRIEIARNDLLRTGVLALTGKSLDEQLLVAQRSADNLVRLQEREPYNDELTGLLADSMAKIGNLLVDQGQREEALLAYEKAAEVYAQAAKLNGAIERYQFSYGKMLGEVARAKGDSDKMAAASQVLGFVAAEHPDNVEIQAEMAYCWGTLAEWQRDGGKSTEALTLESKATAALEPLILGDGANPAMITPRSRYILAARLCHLSELQGDEGQWTEAASTVGKAVKILEPLVQAEPQISAYRRKLAEAYGLAGHANAKAKQPDDAKTQYQKASEEWRVLLTQNQADPIAADGLNWVKKQLESVK